MRPHELKRCCAGWDQELQKLELDLKKNQQDVEAIGKDLANCLVVLRTAATVWRGCGSKGHIPPTGGCLEQSYSRTEVTSNRRFAKLRLLPTEDRRSARTEPSVEETRIQLITQIDRLEAQLEFNGGPGPMSELVRGGRAILDGIQAIAANALQLANNLDDLGKTPEVAIDPADATGSAEHVPDAGRSRAKFTPLLATPPRRAPTGDASKRGPSAH